MTEEYEECDCCKVGPEELPPRLTYYVSPEAPIMFQELHELICHGGNGSLFLAFEMGSIRLNISDPANYVEVNRSYVKVYNNESGEVSIIKIDKMIGFIFEPEEILEEDLEESIEAFNEAMDLEQ